mgnify:CR=1 FL=1
MLRHIVTIDTREQEYVDGKWKGIPGTGEALPCNCCGRMHEIHAIIAEKERDPSKGTAMIPGWRTVGYRNFGVSCAKKKTEVPSGTLSESSDRAGYRKWMDVARKSAGGE